MNTELRVGGGYQERLEILKVLLPPLQSDAEVHFSNEEIPSQVTCCWHKCMVEFSAELEVFSQKKPCIGERIVAFVFFVVYMLLLFLEG